MNAKRKSNFSFYEETGTSSLHRRRHKNFYDVLGLSRDAHPDDIRAAYRAKCLLFHPDKNPTKDTAADFNLLYLAYQTLMDPELRAQYDSSAAATTPAAEKLLAIKPDVYFRAFEKGKKMAKFGALYKQLPELEQLFELEKGKLRFLSGPPCDGGPACQPLYRLNQNLVKRLLPDQPPNTQEGGGQANELPPDCLPRAILCRNHCYLHVCDERCTNENQEECPVFVGWLVSKWNAALVAEQQAIEQEQANEEHDNHFQHHEAVTNPDAADWRMYESEKFPGHMFWFNHRTGEKSWRAPQFLRQEEGQEPSYVTSTSTAEQASAIIPAKQEEEGAGLFNVVSGLSGLVARGVRSLFQSFTGRPLPDVIQDTTLAATTPTNEEAITKAEGPVKRKREPIAASRREQALKKRKKEERPRQATNNRKNKRGVDDCASGRKAGTDGECSPETCPPPNFERLSKNVWICRTHKRPHVCTELQCNWSGFRSNGSVECWATGRQFRYPTQTHLTAEEWRNLWGIGTGQEPPEPLEEQASPHNNIAGLLGSNQLVMGGVDSLIQSTAPFTEVKLGEAMMNAVVGGGDEGDFSTEKRRIRYVSGRSGRTIEQIIEVPIGLKLSTSAEGQSAEEQEEQEKTEEKLQDNLEEMEQVSKEQDMVGLPSSASENAHQERKPRKTTKRRPQAKLLPLSESLGLEKEISQEERMTVAPVQVDGGDKATEDENKLVLVEKLEQELKEDKKDYSRLLFQHRESLRKQEERKHKTAKDRAHTYGAVYLKHTSFVDVPQEDQHRAQYLQHVNEMLSHSPAMVEERQATNSRKLKELRQQLRQPHLTLDPTKEEEDEYLQDNENVYKGKEKGFAEQTISDALDFPDYGVDEEDDLFTMHGDAMDLQELQQQREEEQVNWQVDSRKEDAAYRDALQRKLRDIQGKKQLLLQLRSSSEQQTPLSIGSASSSSASSISSSLPVNE
ncbi:DnaJ subfamily C member 7 [Balamuthia mandrillaris]